MTTTADARVAGWMQLTRVPGSIHKLHTAGYVVEVGDGIPTYCHTEDEARAFLRALRLPDDVPVQSPPS
ncbi:hypothetical protein ACWT_5656 [Actinoplanes sp. SE50]|uniref:hypothetical protein n=1 Tax=unclassified Actinoplanes TaxID=2626549 RepID=UPI00023ED2B7|nr:MULTISPECIES: hypothetical protein [unclassified Actinoplanes]AEV86673.1 hypothetical protein ACPL_5786 [Actinoplanes sp. SE50/110]ATO85071.1 hypothetical protein ACWT_5656 [Actinoplanes sp. SE50]SLM02482.1 hypothetical protein ACSP50_5732 [Actinoplanes sp. SE50/110]